MATDIDDLDRKLINIANKLKDHKFFTKRVQLVAIKEAEGLLKFRVFNKRLAADNRIIGKYKNERYRRVNKKTGFNVDLKRKGVLQNSIREGLFKKDTVLGFVNSKGANRARWNEERYRSGEGDIFTLNKKERDLVANVAVKEIDTILKELVRTI